MGTKTAVIRIHYIIIISLVTIEINVFLIGNIVIFIVVIVIAVVDVVVVVIIFNSSLSLSELSTLEIVKA